MLGGGGRLGMLFFCELYVIRDELALLGRTAHHPRSWASTSYNYNRSWASTSYKYNYQLPPHVAFSTGEGISQRKAKSSVSFSGARAGVAVRRYGWRRAAGGGAAAWPAISCICLSATSSTN